MTVLVASNLNSMRHRMLTHGNGHVREGCRYELRQQREQNNELTSAEASHAPHTSHPAGDLQIRAWRP